MQISDSLSLSGFIDLPQEFNNKILGFVIKDIKTAVLCECICKLFSEILKNNQVYQKEKEKYIAFFDLIPKNIVDAFGGVKKLFSFPCLNLQHSIKKLSVIPNYGEWLFGEIKVPIIRGADGNKMPFICIKIQTFNELNHCKYEVLGKIGFVTFYKDPNEKKFSILTKDVSKNIFKDAYVNEDEVLKIKQMVVENKILDILTEYRDKEVRYWYRLAIVR